MARDPLLHIHRAPGDVCIACGDADTADTDFLLDPGQWNRELRTCSPQTIVSPEFTVTDRADPRTSALKDERMPDPRKMKDPR